MVPAAAEYVKEAVQEDRNNNYDKAFELYKIALEYFSTALKYEKNPRARAAIEAKVPIWNGSTICFVCDRPCITGACLSASTCAHRAGAAD